ncbi:spermidine synthase [Streptomyces syringium]|uniref:Spermidine synthase n=1 Tax=Streptomyces syringium TaxID=76729 RepID=A0ABS4Y8N2_9ACTN|nr:spermidine synthase [Streptomyces syringium]MBP2405152.1 spermidine synthase [Streptomyces syringium]
MTVPYVRYDHDTEAAPVTVERREGPYGEVVLRRRGGGDGAAGAVYEIIANGCFLMDTSDGRSERLLVDAALAALPADRPDPAVLIGGLGVGFSLAHAAAEPRWGRVTVVEREGAVIDWHRTGPFAAISAGALADPRTELLHTDLVTHLRTTDDGGTSHALKAVGEYDALCLDIDNGPGWTVTEDNGGLYSPTGLAACRARLTPGGVLAVWSAQPSAEFEKALRNAGFDRVGTEEITVARGVPDVVHLGVKAA